MQPLPLSPAPPTPRPRRSRRSRAPDSFGPPHGTTPLSGRSPAARVRGGRRAVPRASRAHISKLTAPWRALFWIPARSKNSTLRDASLPRLWHRPHILPADGFITGHGLVDGRRLRSRIFHPWVGRALSELYAARSARSGLAMKVGAPVGTRTTRVALASRCVVPCLVRHTFLRKHLHPASSPQIPAIIGHARRAV